MSNTDFLFSLRKLLAWLFAFLSALLPQHLMAQLSEANVSQTVHATPSKLYAQTATPPRNLDRVVLPHSNAGKAADASAPEPKDAAEHASQARQ